jgi:hypothetical protein
MEDLEDDDASFRGGSSIRAAAVSSEMGARDRRTATMHDPSCDIRSTDRP